MSTQEVNVTLSQENHSNRFLKSLSHNKLAIIGFIIFALLILVSIFANVIAPHDPVQHNYEKTLLPPFWADGGEGSYVLGTDDLGRDILSRIIFGARVSLLVGLFSIFVAGFIGIAIGLISGYYGGWLDNVLMRIVDGFLTIPNILFALIILKISGPSMITLVFVLGLTSWVSFARVTRSESLSLKQRDYIVAARSIGVSNFKIITRHLLPNAFPSIIVIATLTMAGTILAESALSFLGLGVQPPTISWGSMLTTGKEYIAHTSAWGMATFPGIAITVTTFGIIFIGDWLRDVLDPKHTDE